MLSNFEISLPEDKYMHSARVHPSEVESLGREKFVFPTDKFMKRTSDLHLLLSVLIYEQRNSRNPKVSDTFSTSLLHLDSRDDLETSLRPRFVREYLPRIDTGSEHVSQFVSFQRRGNDRNRKLEKKICCFYFILGMLWFSRPSFLGLFPQNLLGWAFPLKVFFLLQSVNAHKYQILCYFWKVQKMLAGLIEEKLNCWKIKLRRTKSWNQYLHSSI